MQTVKVVSGSEHFMCEQYGAGKTDGVDERGTVHDQPWHESIRLTSHSVELFSKDKIAHDVVVEIRGPLRHIERL